MEQEARKQGSPSLSSLTLIVNNGNHIQEQCLKQTVGRGNANIPNCLNCIESFLNKQIWGKHWDKAYQSEKGTVNSKS